MSRIGFLINPIAGMGGRVGLKGTDGVVRAAVELGARPTAHIKASETLDELKRLLGRSAGHVEIDWVTCSGSMGADALTNAGFTNFEVIHIAADETRDEDTKTAVRRFLDIEVDLILFCGGDGTARDICSAVKEGAPILGIPAGVKMYSGVFGTNPEAHQPLQLSGTRPVRGSPAHQRVSGAKAGRSQSGARLAKQTRSRENFHLWSLLLGARSPAAGLSQQINVAGRSITRGSAPCDTLPFASSTFAPRRDINKNEPSWDWRH